jgi:hypothetical protein
MTQLQICTTVSVTAPRVRIRIQATTESVLYSSKLGVENIETITLPNGLFRPFFQVLYSLLRIGTQDSTTISLLIYLVNVCLR